MPRHWCGADAEGASGKPLPRTRSDENQPYRTRDIHLGHCRRASSAFHRHHSLRRALKSPSAGKAAPAHLLKVGLERAVTNRRRTVRRRAEATARGRMSARRSRSGREPPLRDLPERNPVPVVRMRGSLCSRRVHSRVLRQRQHGAR